MEHIVYNIKGEDTGRKVYLKDEFFDIEPHEHVVYLDVKQHLANKRQGTHKSKERGEITGSTRKIKRQKGTGTARAGSIKSPIFRGGGRVFGPKPHTYYSKLNRKVKKLARLSVLADKLKNDNIIVVEDFDFEKVSTKQFIEVEKNLKIDDKKSLLVLSNQNKNLYLSSRNLQDSEVLTVSKLNTYSVLKVKKLVLFESTIDTLNQIFEK